MNDSSSSLDVTFVPQRRKLIVDFLLLVSVGTVIFLMTNGSIWGAVLPSIRAGWGSFRTGIWVLHSDQNVSRARICSAFCIATAFWQAAAAAFVAVIVFVIVVRLSGKAPDLQQFGATMISLTCGVALTTIVGLMAAIAAAVAGIRVWVHPRLREMVHDALEKATDLRPHLYFNHAIFVLATSIASPVVLLCGLMILDFRSGLFTAVVLTAGPLLAIAIYSWLSLRIIATHPAECWK